jgi:translation initiation factor 2 subunit 1
MLALKQGYPEENELVICTVTKVQFHSVFVNVDEYQKVGMIHISEVSPGRIRNIRDFVKEGKVVVCKVLRINKEKGQIDLSLRRVTELQKRNKINEMKQQQKAEKIIEFVAKKFNMTPDELHQKIADKALRKYPSIFSYFEEVVKENSSFDDLDIDKKIAADLLDAVKQRIKPSEIEIEGELLLTSYAPKGVEIIKNALKSAKGVDDKISLRYSGAGKYHITVKATDYKDAEMILKKSTEKALNFINNQQESAGEFVRQEE